MRGKDAEVFPGGWRQYNINGLQILCWPPGLSYDLRTSFGFFLQNQNPVVNDFKPFAKTPYVSKYLPLQKQYQVKLSAIRNQIPNSITALNLMLGIAAIVHTVNADYLTAAWLIVLAAICDFFDGFIARLLHVKSDIGRELDSLADVVSFGAAPSVFLFMAIRQAPDVSFLPFTNVVLSYSALLIGGFSAYRLAKFNLDTRQTDSFLGLPTPANALLLISLSLLSLGSFGQDDFLSTLFYNKLIPLLIIIPVSCYLLVSEIPMLALKFSHGFGFLQNKTRYIFLGGSLAILVLAGPQGMLGVIVFYVVVSVMNGKRR